MKAEIAARFRSDLARLPLGTTSGSKTEHSGPLTEEEIRDCLKAQSRAISVLLTDAEHRRRDVQEVVNLGAELRTYLPPQLPRPPEPEDSSPPQWVRVSVLLTGIGGVLMLHMGECLAIAYLLASR